MACLESAFTCPRCEFREEARKQREGFEKMQAQFEKLKTAMDKLLAPSIGEVVAANVTDKADFTWEGIHGMKRRILGERLHEISKLIKRPKIRRKAKRNGK